MLLCYQFICSGASLTVAGQCVCDHAFEVFAFIRLDVHSGLLCNSDEQFHQGSVNAYLSTACRSAILAWFSHLLSLFVDHCSLFEHSSMFCCAPPRAE